MTRPVYIYALVDPRTQEIRYIGQSVNPEKRLRDGHLCKPYIDAKSYKNHWLKELIALGLRPTIAILETTDEEHYEEREQFWIAKMRSDGIPITNLTDGGDGTRGNVPSPETIEKRRVKLLGHKVSEEGRRRIGESRRGMKHSESVIAFLRKHTIEQWAKDRDKIMVTHRTDHLHTPEMEAMQAKNRLGRKQSNRSSDYIGVGWHSGGHKWRARCRDERTKIEYHLGLFDSEEDAARAYDRKALALFGPTARLNFPLSDYVNEGLHGEISV